jgi:hypothetical protein
VRMVSPDASPTGVQITRQATLAEGSTRVALDLSLRNVAGRSVRWSIWDVVQLNAGQAGPGGRLEHDPGCTVTAPINPHSKFASGYYIMFGDPVNSQWHSNRRARLFRGSYRWEIGKVGLDSRGGWAAFHNATAGQAFAARYTPEPGAEYPDDGADVEFWTVGRGKVANLDYEQAGIYLMECEILSPLRRIAPGESTSFRIEWGACRCPGPVVDVTAGGCASRKLRAERQGSDVVRLTGAFGVFDVGTLGVRFLDAGGDLLAQADLGRVNPLEPVQLDRVLPAPAATGATKRLTTHLTVTTGGVTH